MDDYDRPVCPICDRPVAVEGALCAGCLGDDEYVPVTELRDRLARGPVFIRSNPNQAAVELIDVFRLSSNTTPSPDDCWRLVIEAGPGSGWSTGRHEWDYQATAKAAVARAPIQRTLRRPRRLVFNTPEEVEEFLAS